MLNSCGQCGRTFEVTDEDMQYYEKISPVFQGTKHLIPAPKLCPDCRQQRRLAWRNERVLYTRLCDLCHRQIVSVYPSDINFPVYCNHCWWSDQWDPTDFRIEYNLAEPFFAQWEELRGKVPQLAIQNDDGIGSQNCEYCYDFSRGKNCYRVIGSWFIEDCYYSLNCNRSKNIVDCNTVNIDSELAYECLDSQRLYHCGYLQNCENCRDCYFGFDLKGCRDCFACYGLRQKQFCIFNEQLGEEDYRKKMQEVNVGSHSAVKWIRNQFDQWALKFPRKFANIQNSENCAGNNIFNSKEVLGYNVINSEYCKFIDRSDGLKYCYDLINTGGPQWCCDCVTPDTSYMTHFSAWCWDCKNVLLSDNCHSSSDLFGCIGMRRAKYCILNKQYSKEDYEELAGKIVGSLQKTGDWGEHLPITLSPFGYNTTAAHEYYPLEKTEVLKRGWRWAESLPYTKGKETVTWKQIPDDIHNLQPGFEKEILACQECRRNFRLLEKELVFYNKMPAPLPRLCFDCRHLARFKRKTPTRLWERVCDKCGQKVETAYPPDRPEAIYCGTCYEKGIY